MKSRRAFASLLLLLCLISPLAVTQVYKVTDLGPLAPTAINNLGQVAGNLNGHAFIWTQFGSLDLGTLPGGTFSRAAAINDLGAIVGTADGRGAVVPPLNQQCSDLTQPFIWTPRNGMQGLGTFFIGVGGPDFDVCDIPFYATGINAYGDVVGYTTELATFQWGFLWTPADGMTLIGGNWPPTMAYGVSNTGQIIGENAVAGFFSGRATSWKNGAMTDLGTLGGGTYLDFYYSSSANGVNDQGQIVGWSTTTPIYPFGCYENQGNMAADCPTHAVLWTGSNGMLDLGTLPGDTVSAASNINLLGQVIGSSGNTLVAQGWGATGGLLAVIGRPFIWSARSGMRDLNTLIPSNSGWVLNSATGINFWGQIVGSGMRNGQPHGFLLTPRF